METLLQQVLSIFILFLLLLLGFRLIVFAFQLLLRLLSFLLQGKGASHHQKRPVKRKQKQPLSTEQKGKLGEDMTFASLRQLPYYHKIYRNIIIPKGNSDTTEIDLIVITQYGIIVIENKNYSGYILGRENDMKWCQSFSSQKFFFYNPIKQNKTHIHALSKLLYSNGIFDTSMISVVCFNNQAELKKVPKNSDTIVINERELLEKLKQRLSIEKSHYNKQTMQKICSIIEREDLSKTHRQLHIKTVKQKYQH